MVNQKEKKQMLDFLVSKLEHENCKVSPQFIDIHGIKTDYIFTEQGLIFLVNKKLNKNKFNIVLNAIKKDFKNDFGIVFYKDGKTFFRSAVAGEEETGIKSKRGKKDYGRSLKDYSNEDLNRMISLTPEEIITNKEIRQVQYYQPQSERLNECLVTIGFEKVLLDYSHKNQEYGFRLQNQDSKRLYLANFREETNNKLKLESNILKPL